MPSLPLNLVLREPVAGLRRVLAEAGQYPDGSTLTAEPCGPYPEVTVRGGLEMTWDEC